MRYNYIDATGQIYDIDRPKYNFDTPAEYLKREWEKVKDDIVISPSLCMYEQAAEELKEMQKGFEREECMGTEDHTDIWRLVMDGVEIFNTHKKFNPVKVIYHNPATVVFWEDDSKTVVTCMDNVVDGKPKPSDTYSKETGLALCYMKKALGNKGNYNNVFRKWIDG